MTDQELLQCPLLHGLDAMRRAELLGLMRDSDLAQKVEACVAAHPNLEQCQKELASVGTQQKGDFQQQVRSWKPDVPTWTRSPKE